MVVCECEVVGWSVRWLGGVQGGWVECEVVVCECEVVGWSMRWLFVSLRRLGGVQGGWVECEVVGCGTKGVQFMNEQSIPIFMFTLPVIQRVCVPWSSR